MKSDSFRDFVLDQLAGLGDLACRPMFGGFGLYLEKAFFGIVFKGRLYFRTNDATRAEYGRRGMKPFRAYDRQTMNYHEVPAEVTESREVLLAWARQAISIVHAK